MPIRKKIVPLKEPVSPPPRAKEATVKTPEPVSSVAKVELKPRVSRVSPVPTKQIARHPTQPGTLKLHKDFDSRMCELKSSDEVLRRRINALLPTLVGRMKVNSTRQAKAPVQHVMVKGEPNTRRPEFETPTVILQDIAEKLEDLARSETMILNRLNQTRPSSPIKKRQSQGAGKVRENSVFIQGTKNPEKHSTSKSYTRVKLRGVTVQDALKDQAISRRTDQIEAIESILEELISDLARDYLETADLLVNGLIEAEMYLYLLLGFLLKVLNQVWHFVSTTCLSLLGSFISFGQLAQ
jgi:hypothetical protein